MSHWPSPPAPLPTPASRERGAEIRGASYGPGGIGYPVLPASIDNRQSQRAASPPIPRAVCPEPAKPELWWYGGSPPGPDGTGLASHPGFVGRYRLDTLLGTGGFGEVWRGFDPQLRRVVAIKLPRFDRPLRPASHDQFLAEARKVAALDVPGIVPVYDVGCEGDRYFIVSRYLDSGSLAHVLKLRTFTPLEAARLIAVNHPNGPVFPTPSPTSNAQTDAIVAEVCSRMTAADDVRITIQSSGGYQAPAK